MRNMSILTASTMRKQQCSGPSWDAVGFLPVLLQPGCCSKHAVFGDPSGQLRLL